MLGNSTAPINITRRKLEKGELGLVWVLASEDALYRGVVQAWFKQAWKLVDLELETLSEITPRTVDTLHTEIRRFLKEYEFELGSSATELRAVRDQYMSAQEHAEEVRRDSVAEVKRVRDDLIQSLGQQVMPSMNGSFLRYSHGTELLGTRN
jgi:hypothetical protein